VAGRVVRHTHLQPVAPSRGRGASC
jgi:hypothetical protein